MMETNYAGESDAKLMVMTLPMVLSDERSEGDRHQQDHKWHHDRPVRAPHDETQDQIILPLHLSPYDPSMKLSFVAPVLRNVQKRRPRVDHLQDADSTARRLAATS